MDWPEPRLPFNVLKSFSAVAPLSLSASIAIHLLKCLVSSSMKNDSYTGYSLPANSMVYNLLSSSFTAFRVIVFLTVLATVHMHSKAEVKLLIIQELKTFNTWKYNLTR